jgi:hypothetical protein
LIRSLGSSGISEVLARGDQVDSKVLSPPG